MLSAETVWHARLRRRLRPDTFDAQLRDLWHELLAIESGRPDRMETVDGGCRWHPIPPDREAEKRRVLDELGVALGIGPMPR
jgi:hypothetical protein